jgi:Flp pilus assembly CpaF family ATPase
MAPVMSQRDRVIELCKEHLAPVRAYFDDPMVTEIMINAWDTIFIERAGQMQRIAGEIAPSVLDHVIPMLASINHRDNAENIKVLDAEMPGLRIAAAREGVALNGPCMSIRRHSVNTYRLQEYSDAGLFDKQVKVNRPQIHRPDPSLVAQGGQHLVDLLRWMVSSRANFAVSGATSSGKTTFLNAILAELAEIDPDRRLFTIEDTRELKVPAKNYVSFLAQKSGGGQSDVIDSRALGRLALRMRPDSILHGEVRGPEAYDLMDAYRTGHPGSGVSFHADSARLAPFRLETMVRMSAEGLALPIAELRRRIAETFQFFIHCEKVSGKRMPVEILEMKGVDEKDNYVMETVFTKERVFE